MKDQFLQLQETLTEYFKDFDNPTLIKFIESFSFHLPTRDNTTGKLIEKFLKDNELELAYVNYVSDFVKRESKFFSVSAPSDRLMIENIKNALNTIAFNRFRNMDFPKPLKQPSKVEFDGSMDIAKGTICIVDNFRGEYTLCGTLIEGDYSGGHKTTEEKANCPQCASVVNYCKAIEQ